MSLLVKRAGHRYSGQKQLSTILFARCIQLIMSESHLKTIQSVYNSPKLSISRRKKSTNSVLLKNWSQRRFSRLRSAELLLLILEKRSLVENERASFSPRFHKKVSQPGIATLRRCSGSGKPSYVRDVVIDAYTKSNLTNRSTIHCWRGDFFNSVNETVVLQKVHTNYFSLVHSPHSTLTEPTLPRSFCRTGYR